VLAHQSEKKRGETFFFSSSNEQPQSAWFVELLG